MKLFHRGYFIERFRQIRTAGIIGAAVMALASASAFILELGADGIPDATELSAGLMLFVYIAGIVLTFSSYGWLNRRRTSDFYHALPIKRSAMYGATSLAIYIWLAIGLTACALMQTVLHLAFQTPFNYVQYLCIYVHALIAALQMMAIASFANALCGTWFASLFATLVVTFLPRLFLLAFALFLQADAPSSIHVFTLSPWFNPDYNQLATPYMSIVSLFGRLYGEELYTTDFANIWSMLYSLLYGVLMLALGGVTFVRRESELAGVSMKNRIFHFATRTAFAVPLLLVAALMWKFNEQDYKWTVIVVLVILSFAIHTLYELITTKKAKKMAFSMLFFPICIGVAALYFFVPTWITDGMKAKTIEVSDLRGYRLQTNIIWDAEDNYRLYYSKETYSDVMADTVEFREPEGIQIVVNALARTDDPTSTETGVLRQTVRLVRKNGITELRDILFTEKEWLSLCGIADQNETFSALSLAYPKGNLYFYANGLSNEQAREVGKLLKADYEALSEEERAYLCPESNIERIGKALRFDLIVCVDGCYGAKNYRNYYYMNHLTPNATAKYLELLNENNGETAQKMLSGIVDSLNRGTDDVYFRIDIGSEFSIASWNMHAFENGDEITYSKTSDPEYYEILSILANAKLTTDVSDCAVVSVYGLVPSARPGRLL